MDILGLVVGALLGTFVMTALMEAAQAARITRISIPFMLGAMVSERRAAIRVAGFAMHLMNGLIFALGYALLFEVLDRSDWWVGAVAGALHGAFALVILLPVLQDVHPRMATEDQGPDPTPMLQPPGFLALNYGSRTPLVTVLAHVAYGAIVAAAYDPLG
ncbi:MAG TPA: hypothetical protein VGR41_01815 [Actinomycetota bacterium]|nr:hypothetical protein [Actinomycetota bacterium]